VGNTYVMFLDTTC